MLAQLVPLIRLAASSPSSCDSPHLSPPLLPVNLLNTTPLQPAAATLHPRSHPSSSTSTTTTSTTTIFTVARPLPATAPAITCSSCSLLSRIPSIQQPVNQTISRAPIWKLPASPVHTSSAARAALVAIVFATAAFKSSQAAQSPCQTWAKRRLHASSSSSVAHPLQYRHRCRTRALSRLRLGEKVNRPVLRVAFSKPAQPQPPARKKNKK